MRGKIVLRWDRVPLTRNVSSIWIDMMSIIAYQTLITELDLTTTTDQFSLFNLIAYQLTVEIA